MKRRLSLIPSSQRIERRRRFSANDGVTLWRDVTHLPDMPLRVAYDRMQRAQDAVVSGTKRLPFVFYGSGLYVENYPLMENYP